MQHQDVLRHLQEGEIARDREGLEIAGALMAVFAKGRTGKGQTIGARKTGLGFIPPDVPDVLSD